MRTTVGGVSFRPRCAEMGTYSTSSVPLPGGEADGAVAGSCFLVAVKGEGFFFATLLETFEATTVFGVLFVLVSAVEGVICWRFLSAAAIRLRVRLLGGSGGTPPPPRGGAA